MIEIEDNIVEGVCIDKSNREFCIALEYAMQTNRSIFLTGKAGSGKTTFLKYLRKATIKNLVVLAPTGVAAIKAEGQTIHSFFQISPSVYFPDDPRLNFYSVDGEQTIYDLFSYSPNKVRLLNSLQMLVIDEISMVRADLLDVIDHILRAYRHSALPFGGVQLLLIGDMFQLPPVVPDEEREILSQFYENEFFFSSRAMKSVDFVYLELKKIYRQNDINFINLLNRIRVNKMEDSDFELLRGKLDPTFKPSNDENYVILSTTNNKVMAINSEKLSSIPYPEVVYEATVKGDFPVKDMPTEQNLVLKLGAQVMFIKNDPGHLFYNGKIGVVTAVGKDVIGVTVKNSYNEDVEIDVQQDVWNKIDYKWNKSKKAIEEEVIGSFRQFPVKLAWAITVHKSQGLTFEKVIADLSNCFSPGQVYVALSRCVSLEGIVLSSEILRKSIFTDARIVEFANRELSSDEIDTDLSRSKKQMLYSSALTALKDGKTDEFRNYIDSLMDIDNFPQEQHRIASVWGSRMADLLSVYKKRNAELTKKVSILSTQAMVNHKKKHGKKHKNKNTGNAPY